MVSRLLLSEVTLVPALLLIPAPAAGQKHAASHSSSPPAKASAPAHSSPSPPTNTARPPAAPATKPTPAPRAASPAHPGVRGTMIRPQPAQHHESVISPYHP